MRIFGILLTVVAAFLNFEGEECAQSQTPVEALIYKYDQLKGVKSLIAKGPSMTFARGLIRKTSAAPVADYVDELTVLKLAKASQTVRDGFISALKNSLKSYDYVGKAPGPNGIVDVYVTRPVGDYVHELVVYNPSTVSIFSLKGDMPVTTLDSMRSQVLPE